MTTFRCFCATIARKRIYSILTRLPARIEVILDCDGVEKGSAR